jgi:preprotein translocase subunit SecG
MYTFLSVLYVLVCLFLILVVLLQPGRGGIGGAFGGGSSQTVFGSSGAGNFLTRLTSVSAALFMILSATLAYLSSSSDKSLERAIEAQRAKQAAKAKETAGEKSKEDKPATVEEGMSEGANAPIELMPEPAPTGDAPGAAPTPDAPQPAAPATQKPAAPRPAPRKAAAPSAEPAPPAAPNEPAGPADPAPAP